MIQWEPDTTHNVAILNETIDLYRYFDATRQAEFLYRCVRQTIEDVVPAEVEYLEKYDRMKDYLDNCFEMPDKTVALLIRFLQQGNGQLSERARSREFKELTNPEISDIEEEFREVFLGR